MTDTVDVPALVTGIDLSQPATSRTRVIDPTSSTVTMGFVSSADGGNTPPASFFPAIWIANPTGPAYYASCLVGPAGVVQLAPGNYRPWVDFLLGSEHIRHPVDDTLLVLA
ncbi:MAG: hypothetical protein V4472_25140 [Pseudomonadota bacterium]